MSNDERRRFPRLAVPVFYRSPRLFAPRAPASDVSMGGVRVLTDEAFRPGQRLEIELFLPGGRSFSVDVRVSWSRALPPGEFAKFEAGLEFLGLDQERAALLAQCVAPAKAESP
jgi:PilZ domain